VWSPLTTPLKGQLCYDQTQKSSTCPPSEAAKAYPYDRARLNRELKDVILDDGLSDALIYQGKARDEINAQMQRYQEKHQHDLQKAQADFVLNTQKAQISAQGMQAKNQMAQAAMAQTGLHTEAFAFDGRYLDDYAQLPPPPKAAKRAMVSRFLADHPNKWRAYRSLLRAWHPKGLGFLKGLPNAMYYIAEAHDQAAADRVAARIGKLCKSFGGRALPTTIPFGLRYCPYLNVGEIMANRDGEVTFPVNAKFQASKAVAAMQAFEAFVAQNKAVLDQHGIGIKCNALLHGHFWGIEPVISWRRPLGPYRMRYATEDRKQRTLGIVENAEATAAAIDFRYRLTRMFRDMGSLHVQWAKAYPFAEALAGETAWSVLESLKDVTDPAHTLNPGVLGLGLTPRRPS